MIVLNALMYCGFGILRPVRIQSHRLVAPGVRHRLRTRAQAYCRTAKSIAMAATSPQNASFTNMVVNAMRKLYPEEVADRAWDNVGLLLGNLDASSQRALGVEATADSKTVLLTNDLSRDVAQEAISRNASVIVSYHPIIFRGLKSVDVTDPQQCILLELARKNIAVYCPHTAVDAVPGGLNDWLIDLLCDSSEDVQSRSVVQPASILPPGFQGSGYGRKVEFTQAVPLTILVKRLAEGLGGLKYVMVAAPQQGPAAKTRSVRSAAVCAGSGGDILKSCAVDLLVTGEISHHSALHAIMAGKIVLTVFHSNSERAYLHQRMRPALEAELKKVEDQAQVLVSREDAEPFEIWNVEALCIGSA